MSVVYNSVILQTSKNTIKDPYVRSLKDHKMTKHTNVKTVEVAIQVDLHCYVIRNIGVKVKWKFLCSL